MKRTVSVFAAVLFIAYACDLLASEYSNGPNGINSIGLGLNGNGIAIGQVEAFRPGIFDYDNAANCCNDKILPTDVFVNDRHADPNEQIDDHAIWVAGIMISEQTAIIGTHSPPAGVAQQADLFSGAFENANQSAAAITAQNLATLAGTDITAINMSFGLPLESPTTQFDGTSLLTMFIDWSASNDQHDVLYVVAGNQLSTPNGVPTDNYNGITVASAAKASDGNYRKVSLDNSYDLEPSSRSFTDLIAPGEMLDIAGPNGTFAGLADSFGTSYAAPHVTGTVALLQQYAQNQIDNVGGAQWTANAKHHQVMKAVLLNSTDKIQGRLGMQRTVLKRDGTSTWDNSIASSNPGIPLDEQMGAGALNASRALQQFSPGEFAPGNVPLIGWDYGFINDTNAPNKYVLNQPLNAGDYISVTLSWDRHVVLDALSAPFDQYKPGDSFIDNGIFNLDVYVMPAGATNISQKIASSVSMIENVEHIFAPILTGGGYEIWVVLNDERLFAADDYALAWWAGASATGTSMGDYNGDHVVDAQDYNVWRSNLGTTGGSADGNGNGTVDAADYVIWRDHLGQNVGSGSAAVVPEPNALALLSIAGIIAATRRRS